MEGMLTDLEPELFIHVFVGDLDKPILISKASLVKESKYFTNEIDNLENDDHQITLHFPKDDVDAWRFLRHWILAGDLPPDESDSSTFVRAWALGAKHGVPEFQDLLMVNLLGWSDKPTTQLEEIYEAFLVTDPGSNMRKFMAEELIKRVHGFNHGLTFEDHVEELCYITNDWDSVPGMVGEIVRAMAMFAWDKDSFYDRFKNKKRWNEFLVGDGIKLRDRFKN